MPIHKQEHITRSDLRKNPNTLYVFGDNLARKGYGGQARQMRGEPNAVGIPTKRFPSMEENAFFTDADLEQAIVEIDKAFTQIKAHLDAGGDVVFPANGIGTGRAMLKEKAPSIHAYLESCLYTFFTFYNK